MGIAGKSGSGKSTLIKLLLGLYHLDRGTLRIGDTRVEDIRHEDLIAKIAVVLQETELFNVSLRDNITMMRDLPPAQLQRACEIACFEQTRAGEASRGASTRSWASAAIRFPAASVSASASPEPCAATPQSCCWTKPHRRWIPRQNRW